MTTRSKVYQCMVMPHCVAVPLNNKTFRRLVHRVLPISFVKLKGKRSVQTARLTRRCGCVAECVLKMRMPFTKPDKRYHAISPFGVRHF